jgi:hypothetical protein
MWDIGWRSIALGVVFLLDLAVFADLVRRDFSDVRAKRTAFEHGQVLTVRDGGPMAASANGVRTWQA